MVADLVSGPLPSEPIGFTAFGGRVFFTADGAVASRKGRKSRTTLTGRELWSTSGSATGTTLVKHPRGDVRLGDVLQDP